MKNLITPTWTLNSAYDLKAKDLLDKGIAAIIVDLDNTLLRWDETTMNPRMEGWLQEMISNGMGLFVLSNNNPSRVEKALEPLDIPFQASALKPFKHNFSRAVDHFDLPLEQIAVVGDQIVTDVIGANRMGLRSILVKPLVNHDNIFTWFNRTLEKSFLRKLKLDKSKDWGTQLD